MVPVYITSFNNLTGLRALVDYVLQLPSAMPIIIDNASTYPPLLEWLSRTSVPVVRLKENIGHRSPWLANIIKYGDAHRRHFDSRYYVVTDFDLDMSGCPLDVLQVLIEGFEKYRREHSLMKAGVGIETSDLPLTSFYREDVINWEKQFWNRQLDNQFYYAPIDTTFAVYSCDFKPNFSTEYKTAIRADQPYMARHIPWYYTPENITPEIRYYFEEVRKVPSQTVHWAHQLAKVI